MAAPSSSSRDEAFERDHRLRRRADYLRCYRRGTKRHGQLATLHFHPNEYPHARLGITASRKVGKAVVRQRAKRRVREIFRRWPRRDELATLDVVVHLKPTIAKASFVEIRAEVERLFAAAVTWRLHQPSSMDDVATRHEKPGQGRQKRGQGRREIASRPSRRSS